MKRPDWLGPNPEMTRVVCGTAVTMSANTMTDGAGHQVDLSHSRYVSALEHAVGTVVILHAPEYEGIIPRCGHDGRPWPCPTIAVIKDMEVDHA